MSEQDLLRLLALGDVAGDAEGADDVPIPVVERHLGPGNPQDLAVGDKYLILLPPKLLVMIDDVKSGGRLALCCSIGPLGHSRH